MKSLLVRKICLSLFLLLPLSLLNAQDLERAKDLWERGEYKEAGEVLWEILKQQQEEIKHLKKVIHFYSQELEEIKKEKERIERNIDKASANLEAARLFREGWGWQHKGIFEARNEKEKREYLNKAIEIFRQIVLRYPSAEKADDAQFRIGRIYYAFLKNYGKAEVELKKLVENYPESEFVKEAKVMLEKIK